VTVVGGAAGDGYHRVVFDAWVEASDKRLYLARIEQLYLAAMEVDVLLRHSLSVSERPLAQVAFPKRLTVALRETEQRGSSRYYRGSRPW
jgi:hypothetical protein